jgi:hypothetical protein
MGVHRAVQPCPDAGVGVGMRTPGDSPAQYQDTMVALLIYRAYSWLRPLATQQGQKQVMKTCQHMPTEVSYLERAREFLSCLNGLQCGICSVWMDVLPALDSWELGHATVKSSLIIQQSFWEPLPRFSLHWHLGLRAAKHKHL